MDFFERALGYLEHLEGDKWKDGPLDEDDKLEVQTAITLTSMMCMLSIAESVQYIGQAISEGQIPRLTDVVDYQALLEKYMKGVIEAESVSFTGYVVEINPQEEAVLEDLAQMLGCGNAR